MLRVLPPALVLSLVGAPHVRDALNALGRAELARPLLSLGVFTVTVVVTTLMLTLLPYALPAGSRLAHVVTAGAWALAGALVGGQLSTTAAVAGGILALFSWLLVSAVTGNYSRQDIN